MTEKNQGPGEEVEALAVLRGIREGLIDLSKVLGEVGQGALPTSLVCNSLPKAGTYLLLELAKSFGYADVGFHFNTDHLERTLPDGRAEQPRTMPSILQVAALVPGQVAPAHLKFSYVLENFLLQEPTRRMLFIIRDPRDLVISWVDYVYSSDAYRSTAWNAYAQDAGRLNNPTDEARISASIEGLLTLGLGSYLAWLNSPACLTVRFEELYAEARGEGENGTIRRIADYLGVAVARTEIGKGRTESARSKKIGVWRDRMNDAHLRRIQEADFQKLVIQFGYEATVA